jgi:ribonucleoside-diphosphate reductase alpha chain
MTVTAADLHPETLRAFDGDELRARVFAEKYALRDSSGQLLETTPEQMWDRVARGIASVEPDPERRALWEKRFRWLLDGFRFVPGGRILHAVGRVEAGIKAVPINCFVIPILDDTIDAIYNCAREMALTYARGGGCGTDISILRPKGAPVRNAARTSSGAVSFMETFSLVTGTIGMEGRRGALMITIEDSHPDVLDFCRVKRNLTSVRYANISVRISDAFMRAVEADGPWTLRYHNERDGIRVERTIRARELWNELVEGAARWAEPGCIFWDTMKRFSTTEYNGMGVVTTNPCVTGDTRVATSEGLIRIDDLAARRQLPSAVLDSRVSAAPGVIARAWKTGRKPVVRVITREGYELRATPDHRILTANRGWVPAGQLRRGDLLLLQDRPGGFGTRGTYELGLILGWLVADGCAGSERAVLHFYADKRALAPVFQEAVAASIRTSPRYPAPSIVTIPSRNVAIIESTRLLQSLLAEGFDPLDKHRIPEVIWQGTADTVRGFLQALFTADGTVLNCTDARRSVRLSSTSLPFLQDVQRLLLNFGVASRIYRNRRPAGRYPLPDGRGGAREYPCDPIHELVIARDNIARFASHIGFIPGSGKDARLRELLSLYHRGPYRERFTAAMLRTVPDGEEDVYDLQEVTTHTFIANGITVHNCSEQGLDPYNNCCLGSLNLLAFVRQPFSQTPPEENVDWEQLRTAVRYAVRFLDNVQTYAGPLFPLPQQREKSETTRRVGLGITALGDMLVALGLRYDSDEAIAFTERLMERIKLEAYRASVDLAREKGPFPLFDPYRHLSQEFFRTFPPDLMDSIRAHGLRNAAVMTVPPVGSGAALAGVSSGIEPLFQLYYIRRSESLSQEYFHVLHPLAARYARQHGIDLSGLHSAEDPAAYLRDRLPPQFVTAHEIDWRKRVQMQAAIQRHVDNAISSTINLPRGTPPETVGDLYREAWKAGLKGVTVYVEGSREGVLITPEEARRRSASVQLAQRVTEIAREALPDLPQDGSASPEQRVEAVVRALADALRDLQARHPEQLELVADDGSLLHDRPRRLDGPTYRIPSQFGTCFITITERDGEPYEVFVRLGKAGSDTEAFAEAVGRLASIILRMKGPGSGSRRLLELVYHQLEGIGGRTSYGFGPNRIRSVPDAIAAGLRAYLQDRGLLNGNGGGDHDEAPAAAQAAPAPARAGDICPRCHEMTLVTDEGCAKCPCGYREC